MPCNTRGGELKLALCEKSLTPGVESWTGLLSSPRRWRRFKTKTQCTNSLFPPQEFVPGTISRSILLAFTLLKPEEPGSEICSSVIVLGARKVPPLGEVLSSGAGTIWVEFAVLNITDYKETCSHSLQYGFIYTVKKPLDPVLGVFHSCWTVKKKKKKERSDSMQQKQRYCLFSPDFCLPRLKCWDCTFLQTMDCWKDGC